MRSALETRKKLEYRIRYKNRVVWLVGLSWIIFSGILFYLFYTAVNTLGLYIILSLITFVMHVSIGLTLKTPNLLIRNIAIYPFGIVVAQILNEISTRWIYAEITPVSFGLWNWMALFFCYIFSLGASSSLLRLTIGYETTSQNPINSQSYYLKSTKEDAIELLKNFINRLFRNISPKIVKENELTWMKFDIKPNNYAIAFVSKNENEAEVNLLTCQIRSDILCEADKEETEIIVSIINALFTTWKKQEYIDEWRTENAPKYSEDLKEALLKTYISPTKIPLKTPPMQEIKRNSKDWIKRNKKGIGIFVLGIISTLIASFITRLLGW